MEPQSFRYFKTAFLALIDKIILLEEKEKHLRGVYNLLSKFFHELATLKPENKLNPSISLRLIAL